MRAPFLLVLLILMAAYLTSTHARPTDDLKRNVVLKTSFEVAVPVYVQTSDKTGLLVRDFLKLKQYGRPKV